MKKEILVATAAIVCAFASIASAQTATFSYNDGNGVPTVGTYHPGDSFTFAIDLNFVAGGNVANLAGLSYWFEQSTPNPPFNFAITNRDLTGSPFTLEQTPGLTYPQLLNPFNVKDFGGLDPSGSDGNGTYLVAHITVSISQDTPFGDYFIENVTTGGRTAVITDELGHTFPISQAQYEIEVIPEPSTWIACGLVVATLIGRCIYRNRVRTH
jgi:hypothetical protein